MKPSRLGFVFVLSDELGFDFGILYIFVYSHRLCCERSSSPSRRNNGILYEPFNRVGCMILLALRANGRDLNMIT